MSSSKAKTLRDKNLVVKLVKDLDKRMDSFEDAVNELKILKDSICEMNDQLAEQEASNVEQLRKLKEDLRDNKTKALHDALQGMGKLLISEDEVTEYKNEAQRWKDECVRVKEEARAEVKTQVAEQLERQLKILELQNENKISTYKATSESLRSEIVNLKETISRMSQELDSQKDLTASIAGTSRRQIVEEKTK